MTGPAYAYLHGFASGPSSRKGTLLQGRLKSLGVELELPDLNRPSFAELTISGTLVAVEELLMSKPDVRWRLVGSSLGGWIAALSAVRFPERIERLVLLCPGFELVPRWVERAGPHEVATWEREGVRVVPDAEGRPTPLHWGFFADARRFPPQPDPACEVVVLHGQRDDIVPLETSVRFVARRPATRRLERLDDDHALLGDPDRLVELVAEGLGSPGRGQGGPLGAPSFPAPTGPK